MDTQQTLLPGFNRPVAGLCLAVAAFLCLLAGLPQAGLTQETIEAIQFEDRWPDASPDNMKQVNDTLFFVSGDVLVLFDVEDGSFTETSRISLDAPRGINGIAVHPTGDAVYAACGDNGLKVIDTDPTDSTTPTLLGTLSVDLESNPIDATAVSYLNNYLYLADVSFGLRIYDVSDADDPGYAGQYEEESEYEGQSYSGGYINISTRSTNGSELAFVLDRYLGLRILDVSEANAVTELDTYDMSSGTYFGQLSEVVDVTADGRYVYVSDAAYGIAILDYLSDSGSPGTISKEGQIKSAGSASGLSLSQDGNTLFLADGNAGLLAADMSNPTSAEYDQTEDPQYRDDLVNTESYAATGAYAVFENGSNVFLANAQNGLVRLQPSGITLGYEETAAPNTFNPPADATSVFVNEDYAYVLDNGGAQEGLRIIELVNQDTDRPRLAGFVKTPGDASAVSVHEDFAWVADGSGGVSCIDVSDPEAPTVASTFTAAATNAQDIKTVEDDDGTVYAFIADTDLGLVIAKADSQGSLSEISGLYIENARAVAIYEELTKDRELAARYAVVANREGIRVVDVTDPANPGSKGFLDTSANSGEALDVAVKPPYAVVANGPAGVLLADLGDPENPVKIDEYAAEGTAEAIYIQQSYVHTALGVRGFLLLGISATEPAELTPIDIDPDEDVESPYYNTPGFAADVAVAGNDDRRLTYIADTHGGFLSFLHSDQLAGGINEQPFEESSDDTGCFIQTLDCRY